MSKVHIYIDGTWFINQIAPKGIVTKFVSPSDNYWVSFERLKEMVLTHVQRFNHECAEYGNCYFVTSVFDYPVDYQKWVGETLPNGYTITQEALDATVGPANIRRKYIQMATNSGYIQDCMLHINLEDKKWIIQKFDKARNGGQILYREKEVDTTLVAMLIKDVITCKKDGLNDNFVLIAGDADILPAVKVAYPEYTDKLMWAGVHPDQVEPSHRQSAAVFFEYFTDQNKILFLEQHTAEFMKITTGSIVTCSNCRLPFELTRTLAPLQNPRCSKPDCRKK